MTFPTLPATLQKHGRATAGAQTGETAHMELLGTWSCMLQWQSWYSVTSWKPSALGQANSVVGMMLRLFEHQSQKGKCLYLLVYSICNLKQRSLFAFSSWQLAGGTDCSVLNVENNNYRALVYLSQACDAMMYLNILWYMIWYMYSVHWHSMTGQR